MGVDRIATNRLENDKTTTNLSTIAVRLLSAMIDSHASVPETEALRAEALAWLRRLNGGEATDFDLAELDRWRSKTPAHDRAFAEAALLWNVLGEAAKQAQADFPSRKATLARRAFLAGGAAIAASAAAAFVVRPPLELWPSFS